jgi:hypothetical protein
MRRRSPEESLDRALKWLIAALVVNAVAAVVKAVIAVGVLFGWWGR